MKKILAVGRGVVGKALSEYHCQIDVVSHIEVFNTDLRDYIAIVNCAGLVGDRKCSEASSWREVTGANIDLPLKLYQLAKTQEHGMRFIQLSTTGLYYPQVCPNFKNFELVDELAPTKPYNPYITSKRQMEAALRARECYILRIPWLTSAELFRERAKHWEYVQDTYTSVITIEALASALEGFVSQEIEFGIYNIASHIIYFPDYINGLLDQFLPKRTNYPETMTAAIPVSVEKAKAAGISCEFVGGLL